MPTRLSTIEMNRLPQTFLALASCLLANSLSTSFADESDWAQWRGPNRDGYAAPQMLMQTWNDSGPKLKWEFANAGRGYSAVSIVGGKLYTLGARDEGCFAMCIDLTTGEQIWESKFSRIDQSDEPKGSQHRRFSFFRDFNLQRRS